MVPNVSFVLENAVDYYPYGKVLREFSSTNGKERFLTTHHERDRESGLDYRGARFYDGDVGLFLSLDPLAVDFAPWGDYNYCLDNPILLVDLDGRKPAIGGGGEPPAIISRKDWGAREPIIEPGRSYECIEGEACEYYTSIVIHHAGNDGDYHSMQEIQNKHMDLSLIHI